MNAQFQRSMMLPTIVNSALSMAARNISGLGGDYASGQTVDQPAWPPGMKDLVNTKQRMGGMFVNVVDIFFYSGTASELNAFLDEYSKIRGIGQHRLILHRGAGETSSLAGGSGRACDWKLQGRSVASTSKPVMGMAAREAGYVLGVHFWTEGRIALHEVVIPKNIEVATAKLGTLT